MSVIMVSTLYRAHSSGWGETITKNFTTFEKASAYLKQEFMEYLKFNNYPEEWEECDKMYTDERRKTPAPVPTEAMADELFSVDALKAFVKDTKRYHDIIYGPYSDYECQIPFEMNVKEVSLD